MLRPVLQSPYIAILNFGVAGVFVLLFAAYMCYRIYSGILNQMAKNAKNKRIIKNEVTQWTGREYRRSRRR